MRSFSVAFCLQFACLLHIVCATVVTLALTTWHYVEFAQNSENILINPTATEITKKKWSEIKSKTIYKDKKAKCSAICLLLFSATRSGTNDWTSALEHRLIRVVGASSALISAHYERFGRSRWSVIDFLFRGNRRKCARRMCPASLSIQRYIIRTKRAPPLTMRAQQNKAGSLHGSDDNRRARASKLTQNWNEREKKEHKSYINFPGTLKCYYPFFLLEFLCWRRIRLTLFALSLSSPRRAPRAK